MIQNNSCVEAILLPGTEDFGFFDYFYRRLAQRNSFIKGAVNNKQKSIVMTSDVMYLCQFVKSEYSSQPIESIISVRWSNGQINFMESVIPDTTRYRVATPELWLYLMYLIGAVDKNVLSTINKRFQNCTDVDLYFDTYANCVKKRNGLTASFPEIVLGLSVELTR